MPQLGLGTAPLGGLFEAVPDEVARGTVDAAWDRGVRFFDTAPLYGRGLAETRLGSALAAFPREEYVLSTKVGRLLRPGGSADPAWPGAPDLAPVFDFSAEGIRRSLEESLVRLGLDRVDVVLVHDPDDHADEAIDRAFPALLAMRDEGVVGAVGAGMNQNGVLCRFIRELPIDCVLIAGRLTLLDQSALDELHPLCQARKVDVIAGGVFNSGILANPGPEATYDYAPAPAPMVAKARRLAEICGRYAVPLAAAALQYPKRCSRVTTVLTGARSPEEMRANAALYEAFIPDDLWQELVAEKLLVSA